MTEKTTIQIPEETHRTLEILKKPKETFNDVILRLYNDRDTLMQAILREIREFQDTRYEDTEKMLERLKNYKRLLQNYLDQHTEKQIQENLKQYKEAQNTEEKYKALREVFSKIHLISYNHNLIDSAVKFNSKDAPERLAKGTLSKIQDIFTEEKVQQKMGDTREMVIGAEILHTKELSGNKWKYVKKELLENVTKEINDKLKQGTGKKLQEKLEEIENNPEKYEDVERPKSKFLIEAEESIEKMKKLEG